MYGIAAVIGPLLGGVRVERTSWRRVFYIDLPIGGTAMILMLFAVHEEALCEWQNLNWRVLSWSAMLPSAILFGGAIISLLMALKLGGTVLTWSDPKTIVLFVLFGVTMTAFLILQIWKPQSALIFPTIAKRRSVFAGFWYALWAGASTNIMLYHVSIILEDVFQART